MDVDGQGRLLGANCAVVFPGLTLEKATAGFFQATEHRVRNVGKRTSTVAKLRCHPDARLDVAWALRKIRAKGDTTPEIVTVSDMLANIGSGRSVNNVMPSSMSRLDSSNSLRNTKKPMHEHIFDATTDCSGLASLPLEVLTQILSAAGVVNLGRLACVNKWLRRLASHEYCWVSAANRAGMDWMTSVAALPAKAAVPWNSALGPRLSAWERNTTITLWLTTKVKYVFTNGAVLEEASLTLPISQDAQSAKLRVDQRTPLSLAVAAFVEKHFANDRTPLVHQGRPVDIMRVYHSEDYKFINLNLTAWHHQLSDGDILVFEQATQGMTEWTHFNTIRRCYNQRDWVAPDTILFWLLRQLVDYFEVASLFIGSLPHPVSWTRSGEDQHFQSRVMHPLGLWVE